MTLVIFEHFEHHSGVHLLHFILLRLARRYLAPSRYFRSYGFSLLDQVVMVKVQAIVLEIYIAATSLVLTITCINHDLILLLVII